MEEESFHVVLLMTKMSIQHTSHMNLVKNYLQSEWSISHLRVVVQFCYWSGFVVYCPVFMQYNIKGQSPFLVHNYSKDFAVQFYKATDFRVLSIA